MRRTTTSSKVTQIATITWNESEAGDKRRHEVTSSANAPNFRGRRPAFSELACFS